MKTNYEKIKVMPWQDLLQNSAHVSSVTILQLLTFYAISNFAYIKNFSITALDTNVAQYTAEGYAIEIEGLKRITINIPPLIPTKIINVIKNNNYLFQRITNIIQNLESVYQKLKPSLLEEVEQYGITLNQLI